MFIANYQGITQNKRCLLEIGLKQYVFCGSDSVHHVMHDVFALDKWMEFVRPFIGCTVGKCILNMQIQMANSRELNSLFKRWDFQLSSKAKRLERMVHRMEERS